MSDLTDEIVRLNKPDFYHGDTGPIYSQLRDKAPVFWYETGGFWLLTKYEDIKHVSQSPDLFSSASGMLITDVLHKSDVLEQMFIEGVEPFVTADPPRHTELRKLITFAFARSRIMGMSDQISEIINEHVDRIVSNTKIDVVSDLSIPIPIRVIQLFLGLDDLSIEKTLQWSDDVFEMGTDLTKEEYAEIAGRLGEMFAYFNEQIEIRKKEPRDDVITKLLESELDNKILSNAMAVMYLQTVMVAGNETTRNLFSVGIRLFADYPDQYKRLQNDPSLFKSACEEILRFGGPVIGFMRTATRDTEIRGVKIKKGDHVYMLYGAANRDPDIFDDPETFDIARFRKPFPGHLAFGFAQHVCMGSALARLEMVTLLEKLTTKFSRFELCGTPGRPNSLIGQGYTSLPIKFHTH